jgi:hypothetical protein
MANAFLANLERTPNFQSFLRGISIYRIRFLMDACHLYVIFLNYKSIIKILSAFLLFKYSMTFSLTTSHSYSIRVSIYLIVCRKFPIFSCDPRK